jgi:hypothetical protein
MNKVMKVMKVIRVIYEMINSKLEVDYNEYNEGDELEYEYDLNDNWYIGIFGVNENDIKEYIGSGIELVDDNFNEIKYNLSIENDNLIIKFIYYKVE